MNSKFYSIGLWLLVFCLACAGCSSGDEPSEKDLGAQRDTTPVTLHDSRPVDIRPAMDKKLVTDWMLDQTPLGDVLLQNPCTAMTVDGIHLNPGCDPDVQVNGITAISVFDVAGTASWLVMSGKKFWIYNPTIGAGGEFTGGGDNIATYLDDFNPMNCTAMMNGVTLNPGCDVDVKANGITSLDIVTSNGSVRWIFLSGNKYWGFDPAAAGGAGAFDAATDDWSTVLQGLSPQGCSIIMEGVTLNPGCDLDVQTSGVTTISSATPEGGNVAWMLTSGKKFWIYDKILEAFLTAGADLAVPLALLNPTDCMVTTADGLSLNPSCDVDFQAKGFSANGSVTTGGNTVWFMATGKKFWIYDYAAQGGAGAFTGGGMDIASYFRQLKP